MMTRSSFALTISCLAAKQQTRVLNGYALTTAAEDPLSEKRNWAMCSVKEILDVSRSPQTPRIKTSLCLAFIRGVWVVYS